MKADEAEKLAERIAETCTEAVLGLGEALNGYEARPSGAAQLHAEMCMDNICDLAKRLAKQLRCKL